MTLDMLCPGESATVRSIGESALKRRLQELGLSDGTKISCHYESPLGDPVAFGFASGVVALRRCDCAEVVLWD